MLHMRFILVERPDAVNDTFFSSRGRSLTRASTVLQFLHFNEFSFNDAQSNLHVQPPNVSDHLPISDHFSKRPSIF